MPKRVMSLRGPSPRHCVRAIRTARFEEMFQRWRAAGNTVSDLAGPRFKRQTSGPRDELVTTRPTYSLFYAEACNKFARPVSASLRLSNTASSEEVLRRWRVVGDKSIDTSIDLNKSIDTSIRENTLKFIAVLTCKVMRYIHKITANIDWRKLLYFVCYITWVIFVLAPLPWPSLHKWLFVGFVQRDHWCMQAFTRRQRYYPKWRGFF